VWEITDAEKKITLLEYLSNSQNRLKHNTKQKVQLYGYKAMSFLLLARDQGL